MKKKKFVALKGCHEAVAVKSLGENIGVLEGEVISPMTVKPLSRQVTLLLAVAAGLAVANIYYAQPLLDAMARDFHIAPATIGLVVMLTQVGVGLGLLLVVPLGDLLDRRRLIVGQMVISAGALFIVGIAGSGATLFSGMVAIGLLAGVVQVIVAFAADLAAPWERGRVVGTVTSGVVLGILMARTVAGGVANLAGWRAVYFGSALATLLMAAALLSVLKGRDHAKTSVSYPQLLLSVGTLFVGETILWVRAGIAFLMFAAFSALWTSMVLPLSSEPFSFSHGEIGLFGLVGAVGALAAARAGHLADRGWGQLASGVSLGLLLISWWPIAYLGRSLVALLVGVILLDMAVQALHVTNQSMIYRVRPDARSRMVAAYMIFYSLGSAVGSISSTMVYAAMGWTGVSLLGASFSGLALLFWIGTRRVAATGNTPIGVPGECSMARA